MSRTIDANGYTTSSLSGSSTNGNSNFQAVGPEIQPISHGVISYSFRGKAASGKTFWRDVNLHYTRPDTGPIVVRGEQTMYESISLGFDGVICTPQVYDDAGTTSGARAGAYVVGAVGGEPIDWDVVFALTDHY